jgi:hypothetical protein
MFIRAFVTGRLELLVLVSGQDSGASTSVIGIPIVLEFADCGAVHRVENSDDRGVGALNAITRVSKLLGDVEAKRSGANGSSVGGDPFAVQVVHDA